MKKAIASPQEKDKHTQFKKNVHYTEREREIKREKRERNEKERLLTE